MPITVFAQNGTTIAVIEVEGKVGGEDLIKEVSGALNNQSIELAIFANNEYKLINSEDKVKLYEGQILAYRDEGNDFNVIAFE